MDEWSERERKQGSKGRREVAWETARQGGCRRQGGSLREAGRQGGRGLGGKEAGGLGVGLRKGGEGGWVREGLNGVGLDGG